LGPPLPRVQAPHPPGEDAVDDGDGDDKDDESNEQAGEDDE
jgi:hypothetical protein